MILVITLTKTVVDKAEAEGLKDIIKEKLSGQPDINMKAEAVDTLPTQ